VQRRQHDAGLEHVGVDELLEGEELRAAGGALRL
jgi:hypothetical protein